MSIKRFCLLFAMVVFAVPVQGVEDISGLWHYGIDRNPEYCVRIRQQGRRVYARYLIRDGASGAEWEYAQAEGYFTAYWNVYLWGHYTKSYNRTRKGQKFLARWLLFDNNNKIQTLNYWNNIRIKNYLVKH